MPDKITSKNLTYDSSLPPFLAALKGQASGSHGPDPILAGRRRAAKKRSSSEEAEDAPVVLDDEGNAVSVQFDKDGSVKQSEKDTNTVEDNAPEDKDKSNDNDTDKDKDKDAKPNISFGAKKRKVVKVIGDDADIDKEAVKGNKEGSTPRNKDDDTSKSGTDKDKKVKKKAKKIKLSFDEE